MICNDATGVPGETHLVLVAEDNAADLRLIRLALEEHGVRCEILAVTDGEAAVALIDRIEADRTAVCPEVAVFDLNLPRLGGAEILQHARSTERWRRVPVIVASSSESIRDRANAMELGASAYFPKPSNLEEFLEIGRMIGNLLAVSSQTT